MGVRGHSQTGDLPKPPILSARQTAWGILQH